MIGKLLDQRYQVTEALSQGGFGHTYLAEDTRRPGHPICVVKHLQPATNDTEFLHTARRLFNSEAETLEKLGSHDQIPRLLAYFEEEAEFYLVEEYIAGHPLSTELSSGQPWSEAQVVQLLQEVLPVLEFVHQNGVIHRDIKPDNLIRRTSDHKLVLVDFGAVKQVKMQSIVATEQLNNETVAIGTPGYMPSEQSQGRPRPSSDLYALGMVGIQAITGLSPNQLAEDPESGELLWRHHTHVGDLLAAVLSQMIRHYFKYRYQSASEVLQALQPLTQPYNPKAIAAVVSQMSRYYWNHSYQFGVKVLRSVQHTRPITITFTSTQPTKAEITPIAGSLAPEVPVTEKTITVAPAHPNPEQIHAAPQAETITISINREKLLWGLGAGVAAVAAIGLLAVPRQPSPSASPTPKPTQQQAADKNKAPQPNTCIVVLDPSNVRSAPGGGRTGKVVPAGTRVTATGKESDGWVEISAPATGWIWAERTQNTCPKP